MTEIAVISLVDNRTHVQPFTKSASHTETPVPSVPAQEKYDDSPASKSFSAGSRLNPLHCGNPMPGRAIPIRKLMLGVHSQFVNLCPGCTPSS
jgi:hypothetical protein